MKQRFSSLDVKVIAHELNESLASLRVANIYDLSSKILFKLAKPNSKKQLIVDIGFRCHTTDFARATAAAPSAFVARLRKLLKTRRCTSVRQIGTDRVLGFQFSDGQYRLFLEFFASGNVILTDAELKILAIAHNVAEADGQETQKVGLEYSLENRQNYGGIPALSKERLKNALMLEAQKAAASDPAAKKPKKAGGDLRRTLAISINELPPILVEHVLQSNAFDMTLTPAQLLENEHQLDTLLQLLSDARQMVDQITSQPICTGYICARRKKKAETEVEGDDAAPQRSDLLYEDFHPFIPHKVKADKAVHIVEFKGYNQTVDDFFSSLESQKFEMRLNEREATAKRKLESTKRDQAKRIEGLQEVQNLNCRKAAAIEAKVERIQEAMDAVNGLVAQGMDWVDISKLVEREKKRQNPVAAIIMLPLKIAENIITVKIAEEVHADQEEENEEASNPYETDSEPEEAEQTATSKQPGPSNKDLIVDIDLTLTPWGNAREYYEQRRSAVVKEEKTQKQVQKALRSAEQKINEDLRKGLKQEKSLLQPIRTQLWFEKFFWFVSSDGYLVLAGKDSAQSELLYRNHLRPGDIYCHADLRGAPSVVIKNHPGATSAPIPPATLSQAGSLCVCSSDAWYSKAGMGAWWVEAKQVSKTAPSGDILPPGTFHVQGTKNFLPPAQLLLGLGVLFKISEASKINHVKHRIRDDRANEPHQNGQETATSGSNAVAKDSEAAEDADAHSELSLSSDEEAAEDQDDYEDRENPLQAPNSADPIPAPESIDQALTELHLSHPPKQAPSQDLASVDENEATASIFDSASPEKPTEPAPTTKKPAPPKRGQRSKAKLIAAKYKDQDDDDRAAAAALIGATTSRHKTAQQAHAKLQQQADLAAAKERRGTQHRRQHDATAAHEQHRRHLAEGARHPDEAALYDLALDTLVGTPHPSDDILEALPLCAPWAALASAKYKVKMQPGATKKGKAVKEVVERWGADAGRKGAVDPEARDREKMWPREVALLKALKPEEVINCVPAGRMRVMAAGGSAAGGGAKVSGRGQAKGGRGGKGSKRS